MMLFPKGETTAKRAGTDRKPEGGAASAVYIEIEEPLQKTAWSGNGEEGAGWLFMQKWRNEQRTAVEQK